MSLFNNGLLIQFGKIPQSTIITITLPLTYVNYYSWFYKVLDYKITIIPYKFGMLINGLGHVIPLQKVVLWQWQTRMEVG